MSSTDAKPEKLSIRRRMTTSIKRVLSNTSKKSKASGSSEAAESSAPGLSAASGSASASAAPDVASKKAEPKSDPTPAAEASSSAAAAAVPPHHKPYRAPKYPSSPPPITTAAERAQALFKKHGLEVKPTDLPISNHPPLQRVQKDIRMRIHRMCHKCSTPFGPEKTCTECSHRRCKKCPRQPIKKKDKGKQKLTATSAPGYKKRKGDFMYGYTIPNRRGGQDLVYKEVRQRVHRTCHRCKTDFAGEKVCGNCKHNRCKKCPRHPSKSKNHPAKYYEKFDQSDSEPEQVRPPRRTYKKPRRRVHWTCSNCKTTFIEKTKICEGCGSNRDDTGIRDPPKKPKDKAADTSISGVVERMARTHLTAAV